VKDIARFSTSAQLPITAYASITCTAYPGCSWCLPRFCSCALLDRSLAGPEGFAAQVAQWLDHAAGAHHRLGRRHGPDLSLAGGRPKHLIMDFGIGESMEGGVLGSTPGVSVRRTSEVLSATGVALW
jgi:succinate dehydrogenase / fumarate reductase cytochrome b subunit